MYDWLKNDGANLAQFAGGVASVATALVAIVAAYFAYNQLNLTAAVHREASAREIWKEYIKLCIEHPGLASGGVLKQAVPLLEFEKYEWFVAFMLDACESILLYVPRDEEWISSIDTQLSYHASYLSSPEFQPYKKVYSSQLRRRIAKICATPESAIS